MESNFSFIRDIFPETYKHLVEAERNVRISHVIDVRKTLESLVNERVDTAKAGWLFAQYARINHPKDPTIPLEKKISICSEMETMKQLGWKGSKPLLPEITGTTKVETLSGKFKEWPAYKFLRRYGNSQSHVGEKRNKDMLITIPYDISVKALIVFYEILIKICSDLKKEVPTSPIFNEKLMPIQGQEHLYLIDEAGVPSDAPMSKCQMEFSAHYSRSGSRTGTQYALIRQYDKKDVDTTFLLRNVDTVQKTQDELIDTLPPCMVRPVEISTTENQASPFYIVAYHFQEKPHNLSNDLLQSLDMKSRLFICGELTRCMAELHQMGIYHRLLSYESVYVCDYSARGKGWRPHLVKFDFAKLVAKREGDELATVKAQTKEAKEKIKDGSIRKYIPEDWDLEDWEKVDIYSLGILFCDILSGTISHDYESMIKAMQALRKSKEISDGLLNILGTMISRAVVKRPVAVDVLRAIQTEMASWS